MTKSARTFGRSPQRPTTGCPHADRVSGMETPMITDMVGAMSHLEHLVEVVGTTEQELTAYTTPITPERHRDYVLGNAARIRRALDQLTAPYETAADTSTTTADNTAA
ncbi:hypothetical protein [Streptomyces sp. WAC05858]|uniref:hypothetical protein n=1 Tax=Streptomyces TaxID=1883 RepID=UPI000F7A38BE|nr:hypothetical protein [Streptomyces sp. WAC05858]RSS34550.1 hypothetical protein EF902_40455 [Streptomyces sp. WAC05858]